MSMRNVICQKPAYERRLKKSLFSRRLLVETLENRMPLAVFGFDSRILVPNDQLGNPVNSLGAIGAHAAVGQVINDRDKNRILTDDETFGSAFLVRPNYVMTAAHVVYSKNKNGALQSSSPEKMFIRFGWNGNTAFGGVAGVKRIMFPTEWKTFVDTNPEHNFGKLTEAATIFDYAILELDQNMKSTTLVSFYPDPATTQGLVNASDDGASASPLGVNQLFVSGHPGDPSGDPNPKYQGLNYPQVISTGPASFLSSGVIFAAPRDYDFPNPWSVLLRRLPGETTAAYNLRTQEFRNTSGLDTFPGMSGGPLWVWNDGGGSRQEYQFVGLVSSSGPTGNFFTPVTTRMVADMNRWMGKSGTGIHFAVEPPDNIEPLAIISSYDDLFDTNNDRGPTGVVGLSGEGVFYRIRFTPYNRGQAAGSTSVNFYATLDDQIDPNTDIFLGGTDFSQIAAQSSETADDKNIVLDLPRDFPHRTRYHLAWVITSNADPAGDRGLFPGTFAVDWAPRIFIDHEFAFFPGIFDLSGGDYIYLGETSKKVPILLADEGGDVDTVSLQAFAKSDTTRSHPLNWAEFEGAGANRTVRLSPPITFTEDSVVIVAIDDQGTIDSRDIPITPMPQNFPPVVERIPNINIKEGDTFTYQIKATDRDGLQQELKYGPSLWGVDESSGLLKISTNEASGGSSFAIVVNVTDNGSPPATSSRRFSLTIEEVNEKPVIKPIAKRTISAGEIVDFHIAATDADIPADILTYIAIKLPEGGTFDPGTQIFHWIPGINQGGQHSLKFQVDDGTATSIVEVAIEVTGTNLWHNYAIPLDVTGDKSITPLDVLIIINRLNAVVTSILPARVLAGEPYYDVNDDELLTPVDALIVINLLNAPSRNSEVDPVLSANAVPLNALDEFYSQLSDDTWSGRMLKGRNPHRMSTATLHPSCL